MRILGHFCLERLYSQSRDAISREDGAECNVGVLRLQIQNISLVFIDQTMDTCNMRLLYTNK